MTMTYIEKENALLQAIHNDGYARWKGDREKALNMITNTLRAFPNYANTVITNQIMQPIWRYRLEGADYRDAVAGADRSRRIAHDSAITSLNILNRWCDKYGVEKFADIDTEDRHAVAAFVGAYVGEIYGLGTNTSFDAVTLNKQTAYDTGRIHDRIAETEAQWGHLVPAKGDNDAEFH